MNLKEARALQLGDECLLSPPGRGYPIRVMVVAVYPYDPKHVNVRYPSGRTGDVHTSRLHVQKVAS